MTMCRKWHQMSALAERSRKGAVKPGLFWAVYLNFSNRRMRTRMSGGVGGESGKPLPLSRLRSSPDYALTTAPIDRMAAITLSSNC
jgi:hypothetical protein